MVAPLDAKILDQILALTLLHNVDPPNNNDIFITLSKKEEIG